MIQVVKSLDILYIVIPAYNEEENIEQVIEDWYPVIQKHDGSGASRLVIIDDGSKDKTFSIIQQAAISKPLLCPIFMDTAMHWIMERIMFFRRTLMVRHSLQSLNLSGRSGKTMIWLLAGERGDKMVPPGFS